MSPPGGHDPREPDERDLELFDDPLEVFEDPFESARVEVELDDPWADDPPPGVDLGRGLEPPGPLDPTELPEGGWRDVELDRRAD